VLAAEQGRSASGEGFAAKHLRAKGKKAMEINRADVAELVDARDLKSPGATEITHLSDLTRAGNPHEAGGDPAVLSNTPPPLPLAGRPSKTWADVFLPTSINRRKDRCRLLQSAIASWSLCAAVSTKPLRPPSGSANRRKRRGGGHLLFARKLD
jgi:hypothetical protein